MHLQTDLANDPEYGKLHAELLSFGFHQADKIGDLFPTVYSLLKSPEHRAYHKFLRVPFRWFLIASTIWPAEFIPITQYLVHLVEKKSPLPPYLIFILDLARHYPRKELQEYAKERQNMAHKGDYDDLLNENEKFTVARDLIRKDPDLAVAWARMNVLFNMSDFTKEGVVRRYIVGERGHRIDWKFDPNDPESLMRTALTLVCYRHDLYGFRYNNPLVLKFTVNLTGFGSALFSPKYMAMDVSRDINRKTWSRFPEAYGAARRGIKTLMAEREREDEAIGAYTVSVCAEEMGLEGEPRRKFIIEQANLPKRTDERKLRKLIAKGKKLLGLKKEV